MKNKNKFLTSYKFNNEFFEIENTGEKVILKSSKSWFLDISENLKMSCFEELSTTRFAPKLNMKDAEEVHEDFKKVKKNKGKGKKVDEDIDAYYINIVEELNDFNDWCISDNISWGLPIPMFVNKFTNKILLNEETIEHFADLV